MKIIKIVATRCHILRLKCIKFNLTPDPAGGAYSAPPEPSAAYKGLTSIRGGEGKGGSGGKEGSPLLFLRIYAHGDSKSTASVTVTLCISG